MTTILWTIAGFLAGCVTWNYAGATVKGWLHIKEKQVGTTVLVDLQKLRDDIMGKP